jgi:hypothetical protein
MVTALGAHRWVFVLQRHQNSLCESLRSRRKELTLAALALDELGEEITSQVNSGSMGLGVGWSEGLAREKVG